MNNHNENNRNTNDRQSNNQESFQQASKIIKKPQSINRIKPKFFKLMGQIINYHM